MSKKLLVFSIVLVIVLALTGVVSAADPLKIGVVTPDADHGFTGESVAHARAELETLAGELGFEYKFEVGGEAAKQIAALETILEWGPDAIILWPLEGEQLKNMAYTIQDAGVKLIIYDRLIEGFKPTAEIMGDNETIGKWTGEYLLKYFAEQLKAGETISFLRFIGDSSTVSIQRSGGMDSVIASSEYADKFTQIQADYQTDWSNAKAQEQMENWLNTADAKEIEDLDLIVTHDDEVVDGVVVALTNYYESNPGAKLNVKLITGVGGRRETLATFDKPVANGIDLVTYYFSPSFIRESIRLGVAAAMGEQYDGQDINGQLFLIPSIEIDKTTKDAFRASDVFAERYSIALN
jgi:ribose transport system substrate-binding protein